MKVTAQMWLNEKREAQAAIKHVNIQVPVLEIKQIGASSVPNKLRARAVDVGMVQPNISIKCWDSITMAEALQLSAWIQHITGTSTAKRLEPAMHPATAGIGGTLAGIPQVAVDPAGE